MRRGHFLFSAAHLFVVFFIISVGTLFCSIPYSPQFQFAFVRLVLHEHAFFMIVGAIFLFFGIFLLIGFYALNKKRFFQIEMDHCKTLIDESIIKEYIVDYWKESFPVLNPHLDIVIHKGQKIELITSSFPPTLEENEESLLRRIQEELSVLLARRLGYEKEFLLTIVQR